MRQDHIALARRTLLLATAPEAVVQDVIATSHSRRYDRGATIFLQHERAEAVYIVVEGWVKLYRIAPNGTEAVVGVFTRGASFGEAAAFRHDDYPVTAEAVTDCTLIRIEADIFLRHIRSNPEVAIAILSASYAHMQRLIAHVEALKARTATQRVAEFLLELAPCTQGACEVILPYDKVLIAGRLGMKPESLSRAFARLKSHGVTIRQNVATIEDIVALHEYTAADPALAWARG